MAQLYRKSALEKISSPEQLDKALTVTSPMSWIALAAVTFVIVVTVIWSIVGTIPVTVTSAGIVASPVSTNAVYMPESGTLTVMEVHTGTEIGINDPVATYRTGTGEVKYLLSDQVGVVTAVTAKTGEVTNQGNEVLRLSPKAASRQVIVCYVDLGDAKKIRRGMEAKITIQDRSGQNAGHMRARVINVDSYVSSNSGMAYVLGADNSLASSFMQESKAVVAVTCELYLDPGTVSGYAWSDTKGARLPVTNSTLVNAKFIVEEVRPITKLFTKLKDIWGD